MTLVGRSVSSLSHHCDKCLAKTVEGRGGGREQGREEWRRED